MEQSAAQPTLSLFLEELSLRSHMQQDAHLPSIKLMTLHNGKGLEFPVVFLVGLEEDLFPHINAKDDPYALEEERRLCYVGMTLRQKTSFSCSTLYRYMWGAARPMRPSRFSTKFLSSLLKGSPSSDKQPE